MQKARKLLEGNYLEIKHDAGVMESEGEPNGTQQPLIDAARRGGKSAEDAQTPSLSWEN